MSTDKICSKKYLKFIASTRPVILSISYPPILISSFKVSASIDRPTSATTIRFILTSTDLISV